MSAVRPDRGRDGLRGVHRFPGAFPSPTRGIRPPCLEVCARYPLPITRRKKNLKLGCHHRFYGFV